MSQPPVNPPHEHHHPEPPPGPGGGQPPGGDSAGLRAAAEKTLSDCEDNWERFRTNVGTRLTDQFEDTFGFFQEILADGSKPRDWVKDGIALWIGGYRTSRDIWDEAYRLYFPKK